MSDRTDLGPHPQTFATNCEADPNFLPSATFALGRVRILIECSFVYQLLRIPASAESALILLCTMNHVPKCPSLEKAARVSQNGEDPR